MAARQDRATNVPDRAGQGLDKMEIRQGGHSLQHRDADQIRNEQRGGHALASEQTGGPEPNETMRKAWSEPGGEPYNYRNSRVAAGGKADDHGELTAAEAPETHKHLSDATLSPDDKDATAEAIARMSSGRDRKP